jgi:hypothetical protein
VGRRLSARRAVATSRREQTHSGWENVKTDKVLRAQVAVSAAEGPLRVVPRAAANPNCKRTAPTIDPLGRGSHTAEEGAAICAGACARLSCPDWLANAAGTREGADLADERRRWRFTHRRTCKKQTRGHDRVLSPHTQRHPLAQGCMVRSDRLSDGARVDDADVCGAAGERDSDEGGVGARGRTPSLPRPAHSVGQHDVTRRSTSPNAGNANADAAGFSREIRVSPR